MELNEKKIYVGLCKLMSIETYAQTQILAV